MQSLTPLLLERWDAAAAAGVLRSSPSDAQVRLLDGQLRLILLFNANHAQHKRPADLQMLVPIPAAAAAVSSPFNFTKIHPSEVLCALNITSEGKGELAAAPRILVQAVDNSSAQTGELPQHAVLVNVSPLMRGHALIVFDIAQLKPQRLECAYLANGLRLVQTAREPQFALGFNSTGAWSSVNHFHLQGFFLHELDGLQLPILRQRRREIFRYNGSSSTGDTTATATSACELPDWPMQCYAVAASDSCTDAAAFNNIVHVAWTLVQLLQMRSVPHNVLLARDARTSQLLVIVYPRQLQRENGGAAGALFADGGLRFAVAELSGLVVAGSAAVFQRFSQDAFERILTDELSLPQDDAARLVVDWKQQLLSL